MEKEIGSKEVKMRPKNGTESNAEQPKKLSYDELNQACMDMSQQIQNLNKYIQHLRQDNYQLSALVTNKRLDYLFKVIDIVNTWKSPDLNPCFEGTFIKECLSEIQASLTTPKEEVKETAEEKQHE